MNTYLSPKELNTVSRSDVRNMITQYDDLIIDEIIEESIELMKTYLGVHYNMETEFAKTGANRHKLVVKYLKDIVIYEVYHRDGHEITESVAIRYEYALKWLEKIAKGVLTIKLTYVNGEDEDEDGNPDGEFMLSTGKKRYENDF